MILIVAPGNGVSGSFTQSIFLLGCRVRAPQKVTGVESLCNSSRLRSNSLITCRPTAMTNSGVVTSKHFSQFKSDFDVAPVYLHSVSRIQALLAVDFFVLLVQTLLERELRQAMARHELASLPMYPEDRECPRPAARRLFDLFDPVQSHMLTLPAGDTEIFVTELSPVQREILRLLGIPANTTNPSTADAIPSRETQNEESQCSQSPQPSVRI